MHRRLGIGLLLVAAFASAAIAGAGPARRVYGDYAAGQALKRLASEGQRAVPVQRHPAMRGDERRDYWCFSDGVCFYDLAAFRRVYFAYNDLDDDALVGELRDRRGRP